MQFSEKFSNVDHNIKSSNTAINLTIYRTMCYWYCSWSTVMYMMCTHMWQIKLFVLLRGTT